MANIKSAVKRARLIKVRTLRNRSIRSRVRTAEKKARLALHESHAEALVRAAQRELDRAVTKGVLHPRTAARRKSRLARALNKAAQQ